MAKMESAYQESKSGDGGCPQARRDSSKQSAPASDTAITQADVKSASPPSASSNKKIDLNSTLAYWESATMRIIFDALEAGENYYHLTNTVLEGADLKKAINRYKNLALIQERMIELESPEQNLDARLGQKYLLPLLDDSINEWLCLKTVLMVNGISLIPTLQFTANMMGLDSTPFTIVREDLTTESRARALGLVELMLFKASYSYENNQNNNYKSTKPHKLMFVPMPGRWFEQACKEYYHGVGNVITTSQLAYERTHHGLSGQQHKAHGHWRYLPNDVIQHKRLAVFSEAIQIAVENDFAGFTMPAKASVSA